MIGAEVAQLGSQVNDGDDVFVGDRTIDVHVRKIREKLDKYSNLIETVKGVGYRFKSQ